MAATNEIRTKIANIKKTQKITDAMQLLIAQLAAQGLLNTALQSPNPAIPQVNSPETDSAARIQSLMASLNAQMGGQPVLDAKQSALITQALSRAMKASGQSAEIAGLFQNPLALSERQG